MGSRLVTEMKKISLSALLFFFSFFLCAQEKDPPWLMYQKGLCCYDSGNYMDAFMHFRNASFAAPYPEAEEMIGRIFENEGEFVLALKQYKKALSMKQYLTVPDDEIVIMMNIAGIYYKQKDMAGYEKILESVTDGDSHKSAKAGRDPYIETLAENIKEKDLNKYFLLFRMEGDKFIGPYGKLGIHYFKSGREKNIRYLTASVTAIYSRIIGYLLENDPGYKYTDMESLMRSAGRYDILNKYMKDTSLFEYMFYLAISLYSDGSRDNAFDMLKLIAGIDYDFEYKAAAKRILGAADKDSEIRDIRSKLLYYDGTK